MGGLLLFVGVAVLGFGVWNHLKGKRILAAPFKKTGELAANPTTSDPKGTISTEGTVLPPAEALLSPCSKTPCLYYEVKIERISEKTETTQEGTKTTTSTDTLDTLRGGTATLLDDGTGGVKVDFSKGADFDELKAGFKKELNGRGWASNIQFGELSYDIPVLRSTDGYTIGFKATERFVPVEGSLFVLGKLEGGSIVKPAWRSMLASAKGREGLLGSVNKKKKFSFIGGAVASVLSIPLMIWGPGLDGSSSNLPACKDAFTNKQVACKATVTDERGDVYTWKVTKPGTYGVSVQTPKKKLTMEPFITVVSEDGDAATTVGWSNEAAEDGAHDSAYTRTVEVEPGTYSITVKPDRMVKGGFGYELSVLKEEGDAEEEAAPVAKAPAAKVKASKHAAVEEAPVEETAVADEAEEAPEEAPEPGSAYSKTQLADRLAEIDELCGDTWCEGEFNYHFTALACPERTKCLLSFTAKDSKGRGYSSAVPVAFKNFDAAADYAGSLDEAIGNSLAKWEQHPSNAKAPAAVSMKASGGPAMGSRSSVAPARLAAPKAAAPRAAVAVAPKPEPVVEQEKPAPAPRRTVITPARRSKNLED